MKGFVFTAPVRCPCGAVRFTTKPCPICKGTGVDPFKAPQ